jgi:accessory gene regulator B
MILFGFYKTYLELYYIKAIESISLGILWQSITVTKIGILALNKVDIALRYIVKRGGYREK